MNRRESLKALGIGTLSAGVLLEACKPNNNKLAEDNKDTGAAADNAGRQPFEIERDKKLNADKFFTDHRDGYHNRFGRYYHP